MEEENKPRKRTPKKKKTVKIIYKPKLVPRKKFYGEAYKKPIKKWYKAQDESLKYWRLIRFWAQKKYELNYVELEFILFLYSEKLFTKDQWMKFNESLGWDKKRWQKFLDREIIVMWRPLGGKHGRARLFQLAFKYRQMCTFIYKMMNGEKEIPQYIMEGKIDRGRNNRVAHSLARNFANDFNNTKERKSVFDPETDFLDS